MTATELLNKVKNSKSDIAYIFKTDTSYLENQSTGNFMELYHIHTPTESFYGVYGDLVGGQIDSRSKTDDEIIKGLILLLKKGTPELRPY